MGVNGNFEAFHNLARRYVLGGLNFWDAIGEAARLDLPPEMCQQPHVSFTQLDTYLRCPFRYRLAYIDRVPPDFVPAALAFGSGIHGASPLRTPAWIE